MANNYDRIFKENIDSLLLPLLRKVLGLNPPNLAPIDAKMQVTQEGEMDHIRRVVHNDPQQDYGLQIEFHVRACSGFRFEGENELKFTIMRRKKRSVAALHEHFCNEIGVNFGHL